jgi:hypothetical protein
VGAARLGQKESATSQLLRGGRLEDVTVLDGRFAGDHRADAAKGIVAQVGKKLAEGALRIPGKSRGKAREEPGTVRFALQPESGFDNDGSEFP